VGGFKANGRGRTFAKAYFITLKESELAKSQSTLTPEEEFRQKYPNITVEPEFFRLVGCMAGMSSARSDKDLLIDAIEGNSGSNSG
jgi:hypothetical protein